MVHAFACFTVQTTSRTPSPMMTSSHTSVTPTPTNTSEGENAVSDDVAILIAVTVYS